MDELLKNVVYNRNFICYTNFIDDAFLHDKDIYQQHCEEKDGPDERSRQGQNKFRISEKYQSGSMPCYRVDVGVLKMSHVSKDWKYKYTSGQACASIDNTGDQSIPKMYLFCLKSQVWSCMVFLCLWSLYVGREKKKTIS